MLIDFTVENFRSVKDPVTISMIARGGRSGSQVSKRSTSRDHEMTIPYPVVGRGIDLLPVIGIFGPNASGKTNVVRALEDLLAYMAWGSRTAAVSMLSEFTPFMFDRKSRKSPTRFILRAACDGSIFEYSLSLNQTRIIAERLLYAPPSPKRMRFQMLFERVWNRETDVQTWKNGRSLGGAYKEIQESLAEHEPFMHFLAARLKVKITQPFADWITSKWPGQTKTTVLDADLTPFMLNLDAKIRKQVVSLICSFDTGIDDIEVEEIDSEKSDADQFRLWALHKSDRDAMRLPFYEESTGTQRLCDLSSKMLQAFDDGSLMLADELSSNIHPIITRRIIEMFQSGQAKTKGAQLIFTSHDNTLQRPALLRRDQIWFTQKRPDGSTELYPLTDFHPRNDLAIDRAYLDGRFGAVPIIHQDLIPASKRKVKKKA